jgi:hypothetical protein
MAGRACPGSPQEGPAREAKCPHERRSVARGRSLWAHLGKPGSCELLLVQLCRLDEAGAAFFAQAIAVAADGDDLAVMEQAIENRGRHDRVAEHGTLPLRAEGM